ncbi:MAG TPA: arylsulfatase [Acidimicrobiales bacterium]|nr:arylsulfatase [Acidimicrobiales bacterium]
MKNYEPFGGVIKRTQAESTPWWPAPAHPGAGAPDVVLILLDDTGFSHLGCYGSDLVTPNIDRLAEGGLRFTNFHVTPLCSPTRASLLTGRNHHTVGMRSLSNFDSGYPHMRGHITNHAATVAEVLRDEGYATFAVGKWHLCGMENASAAGPYDQWPCQRGFDRYYGFLEGETDQFYPELVYDNHAVEPPGTPDEGYHLSEDLVDHAIGFIHDSTSIRPDRPFFTYLAFGAMHAPHQAPDAYLQRYPGRFDDGWDVARDRWFARQLEMGLLPADTELAPRNPGVEAWDSLPDNQRRLASRLQEAFAAFLEHTDAQIGRLVAALDRLGRLDNTLFVLLSDNGASQEGGPFGVMHEMKYFNFLVESPDEAIERIDDIGGPHSHCNYPWGWAQAGNTPFKWYKQNTHEGGVHVPLIVHWPDRIKDSGGLRDQFHHVNDIAPTIYEAVDVEPPAVYRGWEQIPISGVSMRYTFDAPKEVSHKTVQYYEMMGHRAIYADGWKAVTRHRPGVPFEDDDWELYHLAEDRSECHNLAAELPDKAQELVQRWWAEAEEHGVLPLDDRTIELFGTRYRDRSPHPENRRYSYFPPMSPLPGQVAPSLGGRGWDMAATIDRPGGAGGVLYASGTENSGVSLFVQDDRLVLDYNCFGDHHVATSERPVPVGPSVVGVRFRRSGRGGEATLVIDDRDCGVLSVPFAMTMISSVGPSVGYDHGSPVSPRYQGHYPFEGDLSRLDVSVVRRGNAKEPAGTEAEERAAMARQ